ERLRARRQRFLRRRLVGRRRCEVAEPLLTTDFGLVVPRGALLTPGAGALEALEVARREQGRLTEIAEPRPALSEERFDLLREARAVPADMVDEQQRRFPEPEVLGGNGALHRPCRRGLVVGSDRCVTGEALPHRAHGDPPSLLEE